MKNKNGYTLVELIITLAVISIMIVPIFNAFMSSNRVNAFSKRTISGAFVAQNIMEELKASNQLALDTLAAADVLDSSRSFISRSASTNFNVEITITEMTNSLNIPLNNSVVSQTGPPNSDVMINIPSSGNNGFIDFLDILQSDIAFNSNATTVVYTLSDSGSNYTLSNGTNTGTFSKLLSDRVNINVIGPSSGTILDWTVEIVNETVNTPLYITKVNDADNHLNIVLKSDVFSTSDVWISNSMPVAVGEVPSAKKWYNAVVRVKHDGIIYETLESTIGK